MSEYQLYEQLKAEWIKRNPNATSDAYEAAISEIAMELGL